MFKKLKSKRTIVIAIVLILVMFLYNQMTSMAYPSAWDRYDHSFNGINATVFQSVKSEMDLYKTGFTVIPGSGDLPHGAETSGYPLTNFTVGINTISKWFFSGYGPFLHYASTSSNAERNSIDFNEQNSTFGNSNYAYISSETEDLANAKSVAMLNYTNIDLKPLLINSVPNSLSENITRALDRHNVKNAVIVGGGQNFDTMMGIGGKYNIVRVGGEERNATYELLKLAENRAPTIYNLSVKPTTDINGVVCDIKGADFSDSEKNDIKYYLSNNDFESAAELVLEKSLHGSISNISSGSYVVLIGCKESASSTKTKFLRSYYMRNDEGFQYGVYQYIGQDYFETSTPPVPPAGEITADVFPPETAVAGDDVNIDGIGQSMDTTITSLTGRINFADPRNVNFLDPTEENVTFTDLLTVPKEIDYTIPVWFSSEGFYRVRAIVTDSASGRAVSEYKPIQVSAPVPNVRAIKTGTEKENRKITIDIGQSTGGSKRFGVDWTKTTWEITAMPGGTNTNNDIRVQTHTEGSTNGTIKIDSSRGINASLTGLKTVDLLFKKPGQYKVKVTLTNTYKEGKSKSEEIILDIVPDKPPVANFSLVTSLYRDAANKDANGLALAMQTVTDNGGQVDGSYSPDGDIIGKRVWLYTFDANNDKIFAESWFAHVNGIWNQVANNFSEVQTVNLDSINDGNKTSVTLKTNHVGFYNMELIVREEFGQDYIPQFVTTADKKTGNTYSQ